MASNLTLSNTDQSFESYNDAANAQSDYSRIVPLVLSTTTDLSTSVTQLVDGSNKHDAVRSQLNSLNYSATPTDSSSFTQTSDSASPIQSDGNLFNFFNDVFSNILNTNKSTNHHKSEFNLATDTLSIGREIASTDHTADESSVASQNSSSSSLDFLLFKLNLFDQAASTASSPTILPPSNQTIMAPTPNSSSSSSSHHSMGDLANNFVNTLFGGNKSYPLTITPSPTVLTTNYDSTSSSESREEIIDFNVSSFFVNKPKAGFAATTPATAIFDKDSEMVLTANSFCYSSPEDYELITAVLCSSFLVLGVVLFTYGYRCFRAVAFFTGLVFGTALAHAVCTAEHIVPFPYGNYLVAIAVGLFVALLTMLVTYIGLFVIGLHLGLLSGAALLIVIYLLRPYFDVLQPPLSALTLLIFFVAVSLVGALSTIYFSKGCTIIASSLYGSALTLLCADYFVENFKIIHWFFDNLSNGDNWSDLLAGIQRKQSLCFGSQIVLALWPAFTLFGIIVQSCITARGIRYRGGYGIVATNPKVIKAHSACGSGSSRGGSTVSLNRCKTPEESRLEQKHRKYRYLYQVRTAHGDVISQNYLQSMQNTKLCLPEQDSFTFNSDLSSHFFPSESRTTTLSVA